MRKKADHKRIEQLEAFARRLKIEDAKKRHLESISKLSDEEFASLVFALKQIHEVIKEDSCKGEKLFKSGLAATERLEEKARPGWRRFCETGGQAAVVDFREATDGKQSPSATHRDVGVLFEGPKPSSSRVAGIRFHWERLATEPEKKALRGRRR